MIWVYGFGFALLHGAYADLMRSRGSAQVINLVFELLAGLSYLIFLIWGFFVFDWWVPIVMPILGSILAVVITVKFSLLPHVSFLLGFSMCCYTLLNS